MFHRVHFSGAALHTALGNTLAGQIDALRQPLAAIDMLDVSFAGQNYRVPYRLLAGLPRLTPKERFVSAVHQVIGKTLESAGLDAQQRRQLGLFIGTSSFDISVSEAHYQQELLINSDSAIPLSRSSSLGNLAVALRRQWDLRGPDFSFNTACTASANALLYAARMIEQGELEAALVVGIELGNSVTAMGFHGLELLAANGMRPFDTQRDGLVPGEAVSALLLTSQPPATPDQRPTFRLRGGATLCDTCSISAANPDGSTIAEVMRAALADADLDSRQIAAVKTHGTASLLNDEAEVAGMRRLWGEQLPPLAALKPFIGHTFGACGLSELLLFCGAVERGFLPPLPGICAEPSDLGVRLPQVAQSQQPGHFLLNYFGFGGNNTSLLVSNTERADE